MNIFEKLSAITMEIGKVNKNLEVGVGKNKYKAVGEADILNAVKELEQKYRIYSYPKDRKIVMQESTPREVYDENKGTVTKSSTYILRLETEYCFVNMEKPEETITVISYGDGVDTQDKAPRKSHDVC